MGDVQIDTALADELLSETSLLGVDELAHRYEHSIKVQLPFLQYLYGDKFKLVPICFQQQDYDTALEIGRALTEVLDTKNAIVIASSDMTHYEPAQVVSEKDHQVLKAVVGFDVKAFFKVLEAQQVTACGFAPIAALTIYAQGVLAKEAKLLAYHTSGDVTGDPSSVVGYASVVFKK